MVTAMIYVLFLIGIILIVKGGDFFVDAASWIAEISGVPKFIVGATIVSLATTLPELLVSAIAAFDGKVDMAVGNAVGSVTANIALIMAISIICMPSEVKRSSLAVKGSLMIAACALLLILSFNGELKFTYSIIILALFVVFIVENVSEARKSMFSQASDRPKTTPKETAINILKFIVGAAGIVIGADLLVDNGSAIARMLGVSESIIGVTVIAIGTSLPELVTTVTAVAKKESSLSIGNILGANIIDLTLILPVCSIITGGSLPIAAQSARIDLPVCLLVSLIAVVPAFISRKFKRITGVLLVIIYLAYLYAICI